jgi:WD40 repeat protein
MTYKTILFATLLGALATGLQSQSIIWSQKGNSNSSLSTYGVAFSANGEKLLSGSECHPANIRMFDVVTGNLEWNYDVGTTFMCIQGVKFSSNGSLIASVEELGNILIFDNTGATPVIVDTIDTGTSYAFATDFTPANDRIAVGASSGKMNIYNLPGGSLFKSVAAHSGYVYSVAYSPDGAWLASGGADNKVKIWTADGVLKFALAGHDHDVTSVKFTPDNAFLVTGGRDGNVKIWNTADGSIVRTIDAHNAEIKQVDVSADGSMIVSASSDQTSRIWNFQTGELLSTFGNAGGGVVWSAVWSPDGSKIATGTSLGDVILWDVAGVSGANEHPDALPGVEIFPNPATDFIHLKRPAGLQLERLEICDGIGKVLRRLDPAGHHFPIQGLPAGILFLKITTPEGQVSVLRFFTAEK